MDDLFGGFEGEIEIDIKCLQTLAIEVDRILREELTRSGVDYDYAEARVYNIKTVGVQGDDRTYGHPAKITLFKEGRALWDGYVDFIEHLSTRITNEVRGVNRVVYVFEKPSS